MKVKVGWIMIVLYGVVIIPATYVDAALFENPETRQYVARSFETASAQEIYFNVNVFEWFIFSAGIVVGMYLGDRQVEFSPASFRRVFSKDTARVAH